MARLTDDQAHVKVLKFGGTSLGTAERINTVASIIQDVAAKTNPIVIVSAVEGVTNQLVLVATDAGTPGAEEIISIIRDRHRSLGQELLNARERGSYLELVDSISLGLRKRASAFRPSEAITDEILAAGERLSAPLVAGCLRSRGTETQAWDAAGIIRTDSSFGEAIVDWVRTAETIRHWHKSLSGAAVVTGFIGSDANGRTTTLGRGGSDYSAAIFASALGASVLERWTDVDGIYTDDPAKNGGAEKLGQIHLDEAHDWNQDGRIGMHRDALEPVKHRGIPVHVRSTLTPHREGTWIVPKQEKGKSSK